VAHKGPVHTSNNVKAILSNVTSRMILSTKSNVTSTLLPFLATMLSFLATISNKSFVKFRPFDKVAICPFNNVGVFVQSEVLTVIEIITNHI